MLLSAGLYAQNKTSPKINGRIQFDYEFLKREKDTAWFIGNEFRRVHMSASGKLSEVFKYKVEINFSHAQIGFRDVYLEYTNEKWGHFAIGSKAEPTGLDIATSSKYIPFAERAMLTALQDFRWGAGFHYAHHGLLDNRMGIQLALTNKGANDEGFIDKELNKGMNAVWRIYGQPYINTENYSIIHLGFNGATRPYKDLKFRPENHMGDKYHYIFTGGTRRLETGAEAALVYKNYSIQGEYKQQIVANNVNKNYRVQGYYLLGSIFLTGEHRNYKHGHFGRVKPEKDVTKGGWGAWEILARYSVMQFSEDITADPQNAGLPARIQNTGVGINWYLTSHIRVMYNYLLTLDGHPNGRLYAHLIRFQVDF